MRLYVIVIIARSLDSLPFGNFVFRAILLSNCDPREGAITDYSLFICLYRPFGDPMLIALLLALLCNPLFNLQIAALLRSCDLAYSTS